MTAPVVPETISDEQYIEASRAFCEALGINPNLFFRLLILTENQIDMFACVSDDYTAEYPEGTLLHSHPQGDPTAEAMSHCIIKVVAS